MYNKGGNQFGISLILILLLSVSCGKKVENYTEKVILENKDDLEQRIADARQNTPIELSEGLEIKLWATDSLAPDPIALYVDDKGRVYMTRTNRQKNSEFDIRGHRDWMTASISLQSVEDRRAFLRSTFSTDKSDENNWLADLNQDSVHDWRDLTVERDEIWRLEDPEGIGAATISTRILEDFDEEVSDVAGALLVRDNDMFVGIAPDMWRITDENNDGKYDTKTSISHGYGIHIGFGGHGMSGAVQGPDGRIYWGIGDIGANIKTADGRHFNYPNQGVIVRSNPDGSDFEVFAHGLRNTHEFVFDELGNIITSDNDGDHPGESERLMYVVEGSDAGWRANWQYGKYTDPKNNTYKVWMDEKLYVPRWEGQAAYIIPPIMNFHNGPAGMAYNPGTALGKKWKNKFFLSEFVGIPSGSPIWAFSLKPSGASFVLDEEEKMVLGILPTGLHFGPDGALYVADWINGWNTKNYGRVWRVDVTEEANDHAEERIETKRLMTLAYHEQDDATLYDLMSFPDLRIRQKAQFELASRGDKSLEWFVKAIAADNELLTRVHGIRGIGQLSRLHGVDAEPLQGLLGDGDHEVVAQAARELGDIYYADAGDLLIPLLTHENLRVRFFTAQALGRIKHESAIPELIKMLEVNADEDLYIRHAGVLALSRIGKVEPIIALHENQNAALRLAAVLVLRKLQHEDVALFLDDESEYIVAEAARAINDDWSIEPAMPQLAAIMNNSRFTAEPILRRAINAASRLGADENIAQLGEFLGRQDVSSVLKSEVLNVLANWGEPSVLDRVDGRFRGEVTRDDQKVKELLQPVLPQLLSSGDSLVMISTVNTIASLGLKEFEPNLVEMVERHSIPAVRAAALDGLHTLDYDDKKALTGLAMKDDASAVRTRALSLIANLDLSAEEFAAMAEPILRVGDLRELQQLIGVMGRLPIEQTTVFLEQMANEWINDELDPGISLDLIEAIDESGSEELIALIEPHRPSGNTTADFMDVLYGGDSRNGGRIAFTNTSAQCLRCHTWGYEPNAVGPPFEGMASRLTREQILEALIEPSARIAPGYGSVILTLKDGSKVTGVLLEEDEQQIILKTNNAEPLEIAKQRIEERQNLPSGMPPMGMILTRREIRDVVEFLSNFK